MIYPAIAIFFLLSFSLYAQYKVYTWENFEEGTFPPTLHLYGDANLANVFPFRYEQLPNLIAIFEGNAKSECGRYGLCLKTGSGSRYLRVIGENILKRDLLQEHHKAIIQADFYMQNPSQDMVGMALLAAEILPSQSGKITTYYRLGINRLGQVYFSYIDGRIQERPLMYVKQESPGLKLKTPGWHRFQMVFQGQSKIKCFVDAKETDFSPLSENSLKTIGMGVMISGQPNPTVISIIDNLSIQLAEEDIPLPNSPWDDSESANNHSLFKNQAPHIPAATFPDLFWHNTAEEAVQANAQIKKPYLVLFFSPFVKANSSLNQIINSDISARNFFKQYVLVAIDVNQLAGGALAQKCGVFKLPCFVTMDFNGMETSRLYFKEDMEWKTIENNLKGKSQ